MNIPPDNNLTLQNLPPVSFESPFTQLSDIVEEVFLRLDIETLQKAALSSKFLAKALPKVIVTWINQKIFSIGNFRCERKILFLEKYGSNLIHIDEEGFVKSEELKDIISYCPKLQSLTTETEEAISQDLIDLISRLSKLTHLGLKLCHEASRLDNLNFGLMPKLDSLTVHIELPNRDDVESKLQHDLFDLPVLNSRLRKLKLKLPANCERYKPLNYNYPELEELDIECGKINTIGVRALGSLKKLSICASKIEGLEMLKSLMVLNINGFDGLCFEGLANLKELEIISYVPLSLDPLINLERLFFTGLISPLGSLTALRKLRLIDSHSKKILGLASLTNLEVIEIMMSRIKHENLPPVSNYRNLKTWIINHKSLFQHA